MQSLRDRPYQRLCADFRWDIPARYNAAERVRCWAQATPDVAALIAKFPEGGSGHFSYQRLERTSNRLANLWRGSGLSRGERIAIMLPPCFEAAVAHLAALKAGLVVVPLYPGMTASALELRVRESGARVLVLDRKQQSLAAQIEPALAQCDTEVLVLREPGERTASLLDATVAGIPSDCEIAQTSPDDPAFLAFTSGSEGTPKGLLHGHGEVLAAHSSFGLRSRAPQPGEIAWTTADWSWLLGLNIALVAWHTGGTVLVQDGVGFSPKQALTFMADFGVDHASLPPSALALMSKTDASEAHHSLKSLSTGGEALPPEIFDWARSRFGIGLDEFYGMSECPGVIGNGDLVEARRGAMGLALPGHLVEVVDETGRVLAPDETGYIAIHKSDPGLFLGYWEAGMLVPPRLERDFFLTSDLARKDADGYFWYVGRADDVIKSGSFRIGPGEIEDCALSHPAIELAGAVGIEDRLLGKVVKLWVQLAASYQPTEALKREIAAHMRQHLSAYQLPRTVAFIDAMPLTATGKINRRQLRELG